MNDLDLSPERMDGLRRAEQLARKINLLLDTAMTRSKRPVGYSAVRDRAMKDGYFLSRTRWSLLKNGKEQVITEEALCAIAKAFDVTPEFLLQDDGDLPQQVEARLEEVRAKRRAEVRDAATRALGFVDPEALKAITKILDSDA